MDRSLDARRRAADNLHHARYRQTKRCSQEKAAIALGGRPPGPGRARGVAAHPGARGRTFPAGVAATLSAPRQGSRAARRRAAVGTRRRTVEEAGRLACSHNALSGSVRLALLYPSSPDEDPAIQISMGNASRDLDCRVSPLRGDPAMTERRRAYSGGSSGYCCVPGGITVPGSLREVQMWMAFEGSTGVSSEPGLMVR